MVVRGRGVKKKRGGEFLNQRKNIVSSRIIGLKNNFVSNTNLVGREGGTLGSGSLTYIYVDIPNLDLLLFLETFKNFFVGGGGGGSLDCEFSVHHTPTTHRINK